MRWLRSAGGHGRFRYKTVRKFRATATVLGSGARWRFVSGFAAGDTRANELIHIHIYNYSVNPACPTQPQRKPPTQQVSRLERNRVGVLDGGPSLDHVLVTFHFSTPSLLERVLRLRTRIMRRVTVTTTATGATSCHRNSAAYCSLDLM